MVKKENIVSILSILLQYVSVRTGTNT